jgi:hypothetical protein
MKLEQLFQNTIFLLGAGASMDAKCLSSSKMLQQLKENIKLLDKPDEKGIYNKYQSYKKEFHEIYEFVLASINYQQTLKNSLIHNNSYLNIEDFVMVLRQLKDKEFIIPYPLVGNWNDKIIKWELKNEKNNIFEEFKNFIINQLVNSWTRYNSQNAQALLKPIRELLYSAEEFKINVFSLNYDLIFEENFNTEKKRLLENGFTPRKINDKKVYLWSDDVFEHRDSAVKINLYKLHGSLNWEYDNENEVIGIKKNIFDGEEPLIIFGSSYKMLSFDPFLFILSEFRKKLQNAQIFVVIGYSFHDKYINNLLIQQLSQPTSKKMMIVDPDLKMSPKEFTEKLENIQNNKSINDVINFKKLNPAKLEILKSTAKEFFKDYFSNKAKKLGDLLQEAEKEDRIF